MPISGVLLTCEAGRADEVRRLVDERSRSEVRSIDDAALVVVTDTTTLDEDRAEVEALGRLDGVAATNVVFSNIEDIAEAATGEGR